MVATTARAFRRENRKAGGTGIAARCRPDRIGQQGPAGRLARQSFLPVEGHAPLPLGQAGPQPAIVIE
jgi:hypothetical protein